MAHSAQLRSASQFSLHISDCDKGERQSYSLKAKLLFLWPHHRMHQSRPSTAQRNQGACSSATGRQNGSFSEQCRRLRTRSIGNALTSNGSEQAAPNQDSSSADLQRFDAWAEKCLQGQPLDREELHAVAEEAFQSKPIHLSQSSQYVSMLVP
jgi:hypothetical protein